ncbi:MAG: hypothetical protein AAF572_06800 [Cyanobacteria bacterium P01_B01_bin.77]
MVGKIRRNDFLKAQNNLLEFFSLKLRHDLCEGSKKHIHRGLIIRLLMMEKAILDLDSEVGNSNEPLSHNLSIELTLLLNAYSLNLAGSLDNLAWALAYQHNLIKDIDKDNSKHRRLAQLVSKDFLKLLQEHRVGALHTMLEPLQKWYWDIREFRDPFAHRIPLYVPPAVCTEDDEQRAEEWDKQAAELMAAGEWESGRSLMYQSLNVGQHLPVFIAEVLKIQIYDLAGRIDDDHGIWLGVVDNVLQEGFHSKFQLKMQDG